MSIECASSPLLARDARTDPVAPIVRAGARRVPAAMLVVVLTGAIGLALAAKFQHALGSSVMFPLAAIVGGALARLGERAADAVLGVRPSRGRRVHGTNVRRRCTAVARGL